MIPPQGVKLRIVVKGIRFVILSNAKDLALTAFEARSFALLRMTKEGNEQQEETIYL